MGLLLGDLLWNAPIVGRHATPYTRCGHDIGCIITALYAGYTFIKLGCCSRNTRTIDTVRMVACKCDASFARVSRKFSIVPDQRNTSDILALNQSVDIHKVSLHVKCVICSFPYSFLCPLRNGLIACAEIPWSLVQFTTWQLHQHDGSWRQYRQIRKNRLRSKTEMNKMKRGKHFTINGSWAINIRASDRPWSDRRFRFLDTDGNELAYFRPTLKISISNGLVNSKRNTSRMCNSGNVVYIRSARNDRQER